MNFKLYPELSMSLILQDPWSLIQRAAFTEVLKIVLIVVYYLVVVVLHVHHVNTLHVNKLSFPEFMIQ